MGFNMGLRNVRGIWPGDTVYLAERVSAHLSMVKTIQKTNSKDSNVAKLTRKSKKRLKSLKQQLTKEKITNSKKLNSALDESLKNLKKMLSLSSEAKKKERRKRLVDYLESLTELHKSRFV